jgi:hypothetical protein
MEYRSGEHMTKVFFEGLEELDLTYYSLILKIGLGIVVIATLVAFS